MSLHRANVETVIRRLRGIAKGLAQLEQRGSEKARMDCLLAADSLQSMLEWQNESRLFTEAERALSVRFDCPPVARDALRSEDGKRDE